VFAFLSLSVFSVASGLLAVVLASSHQSNSSVPAIALMYTLFSSFLLFATYPLNLTRTFILFSSLLLTASFLRLNKSIWADL
jgi:hypothetical protein